MPLETIYHPVVSRMTVPYGAAIDASLGGLITNWYDSAFTFVLYGDIWFAAALWNGYGWPTYRVLLRVKNNGQFCWYSDTITPQRVVWNAAYENVNSFAPTLNGNVFTSQTHSDIKTLTLPSYFVNGGWVYLPPQNKIIPQPCGINAQNITIKLSYNGLALVEYSNGHPLSYDLWAATGTFDSGNFVIGNGGYVGNIDNNSPDPIFENSSLNRLYGGITYGVGTGCVSYTPFGLHGKDVEFVDLYGNFDVFFSGRVFAGALTCDGKGRPLPAAAINFFRILDRSAPEFAGTQFQSHYQSGCTSASDIQNVYCIGNRYNELALFDGTNFVAINSTVGLGSTGNMGIIDNRVVQVTSLTKPSILISQPLNLPPLAPPPVVNSPLASSLLNWHRPISTRGLFKT